MPEQYGGGGGDRLYSTVLIEEDARAGPPARASRCTPTSSRTYLPHFGTEEQKQTWLPRMARGETIGAIAMTEPGTGSDLQAIRTTAVRDGDEYVINGTKTFITNGQNADLVDRRRQDRPRAGAKGISLFLVEADQPGFRKGKRLKKLGLKAQDTSELFFDDVRVPAGNLLGERGPGLHLPDAGAAPGAPDDRDQRGAPREAAVE